MASPSALDRLIGWVSPQTGLQRHFARLRLARAYEAADPRDGFKPRRRGASANADHLADAAALRAKARSLVQNVPYIAAGLKSLVSYTVGTGIMPRAVGPKEAADRFNALLEAWFQVCDADGRLDWYGMQAAAYRAMEQDGEALIRLRPRRPSDGLPIPLQLQLLEIDWLDSAKTGSEGANQVINGVEYDPLGRTVAYWLLDRHPGDVSLSRSNRGVSKRVPASSVIHLFNPERPGQGRGFTRLASVITRVHDLRLYEDAEIARKNLESRLSVLATGDATLLANDSQDDAQARAAKTGDLGDLSSGGITQLPAGLNLQVIEPKAAPGYVDYVKHQLHLIAAGMGVTYEMLTGDMAEVNFSSARVRRLDFKRDVDAMQWNLLIPRLCDRVCREALEAARLANLVGNVALRFEHSPPKWEYVNPEQDVKSDMAEISAGLSSISEKLRQRGYQPDRVFAEIKSDFERLEADGTLRILTLLQRGVQLDPAAPPPPGGNA